MNSRDLVIRTLGHKTVERVPRDLWTLPGINLVRRDELKKLLDEYPSDFAIPEFSFGKGIRSNGVPHEVGEYTDAWGCVWRVAERGVVGEVKVHPFEEWPALDNYRPPYEILSNADFTHVNESCAATDRFVLAGSTIRPFERMQFLRGPESLYIDFAYDPKELRQLIDMLHDFYLEELRMWVETDVDGVAFMDDWGSQTGLLISPDQWREIFKPLYSDYCRLIHQAGKFAFFHSDGEISSIIGDLIEIGVDALNSQLFCMDIEKLADEYRGKITFWGEIDRQNILPFGTEDDVRAAVRRVRKAFDRGRGGIIAQCEWGLDVPYANIAAVFDEWAKPLEVSD